MRSIARTLIVLLHLSGASAQQVKAQPAAASTEPRTVRFGVVVDAEGTQQEFVHLEGADPAVEVRAFFWTRSGWTRARVVELIGVTYSDVAS